jgi:hypothetical protein
MRPDSGKLQTVSSSPTTTLLVLVTSIFPLKSMAHRRCQWTEVGLRTRLEETRDSGMSERLR